MTNDIALYYQPAKGTPRNHLLLLLPGSTGIDIFGDTKHFFLCSNWLNRAGWDTLIVDYTPAIGLDDNISDIGAVIAHSLEMALSWFKEDQTNPDVSKFSILAWSLGGEGIVHLLQDVGRFNSLGIENLVLYFPSNMLHEKPNAIDIPILILTGDIDNVTTLDEILQTYSHFPKVQFVVYKNAHHGFDVRSLKNNQRFVNPETGAERLLAYHKASADRSRKDLFRFLNSN